LDEFAELECGGIASNWGKSQMMCELMRGEVTISWELFMVTYVLGIGKWLEIVLECIFRNVSNNKVRKCNGWFCTVDLVAAL
jgi:hypothetical protein